MKLRILTLVLISFSVCTFITNAQTVDYSIVSVPEESGVEFKIITSQNDYVCMPQVIRKRGSINWLSNIILDISTDGNTLAYLSFRNNATNIFITDINKQGSSVQRTNRAGVMDFKYSADGKYLCFSEARGNENQIYRTDAQSGYICRQITSGNKDYSPVYSDDMENIFFCRQEQNGMSIWSYNITDNFLSSYTSGMNPYPVKDENSYLCTRVNSMGYSEIWKINYETNSEECIISDHRRSFTSPSLSPDGKRILFVGSNSLSVTAETVYMNTDIFVCNIDGTDLMQLTYHAADDLSPIWSKDGKYIYFISQRGSANATANIWRMTFNY